MQNDPSLKNRPKQKRFNPAALLLRGGCQALLGRLPKVSSNNLFMVAALMACAYAAVNTRPGEQQQRVSSEQKFREITVLSNQVKDGNRIFRFRENNNPITLTFSDKTSDTLNNSKAGDRLKVPIIRINGKLTLQLEAAVRLNR